MKAKTLTIEGVEYQYRIRHKNRECGVDSYTDFYLETHLHSYKKYRFFGETITVEIPIVKFTIGCDIESPYCGKKYIRELIDRELKPLKRLEEIKRGEII